MTYLATCAVTSAIGTLFMVVVHCFERSDRLRIAREDHGDHDGGAPPLRGGPPSTTPQECTCCP